MTRFPTPTKLYDMTRDFLWALRWLRKNPLFTAGIVLILSKMI